MSRRCTTLLVASDPADIDPTLAALGVEPVWSAALQSTLNSPRMLTLMAKLFDDIHRRFFVSAKAILAELQDVLVGLLLRLAVSSPVESWRAGQEHETPPPSSHQ
jgi:hypothetical protein